MKLLINTYSYATILGTIKLFLSLQDVIGCTQEMDFILWPRNDIEKIVCLLFSRWKGSDDEPFRPIQVWHMQIKLKQMAFQMKTTGAF